MSPLEVMLRGTLMYWLLFIVLRFILRRDAAQNSMIGGGTSTTDGMVLIGTLVFWSYMRLAPSAARRTNVFGGVNCYNRGSGPPLVLVHSVNAAPSAAEMRPLFEHYSATRTVFAIDLPGFGLSDRSDRRYDPRLMTDALHALAEQVRNRCGAVPMRLPPRSAANSWRARPWNSRRDGAGLPSSARLG